MKRFFSIVVTVLLLALIVGDLEAGCGRRGLFRGRRQAARAGGCGPAPQQMQYPQYSAPGGCANGQCAVAVPVAPVRPVIVWISPLQLYARR